MILPKSFYVAVQSRDRKLFQNQK